MQNLFNDFYVLCKIMVIVFIMLVEFWVNFFQTFVELLVKVFNQNGTSPSKTHPPPRSPIYDLHTSNAWEHNSKAESENFSR